MVPMTSAKQFEADVRTLLRLSGDVGEELQLEHKKIDLLLEQARFGQRRKIAVECKSNQRALSMPEAATIVEQYRPLLESGAVDEVLVVTRAGLSANAHALVSKARGFAHLTLEDLANDVLDLSGHLALLEQQYFESLDGLASYYIEPRSDGGHDLLGIISRWVAKSDRPMAILGAYGTGKSTFATYLGAHLAQLARADASLRRPVLIRLSDISSEQSLEGLLGRTLGSTVAAPNYSFDRFIALNRSGRFVVILDGFDEMKRTLSWEGFKYNLSELNRLVDGAKSRVLILGRPTAFLNDDEYDLALHGRQTVGKNVVDLPDWPDYVTTRLGLFATVQIEEFLDAYLRHVARAKSGSPSGRAATDVKRAQRLDTQIKHTIAKVVGGHLQEIARRPVQLKMLAEILPGWRGSLDALDTATLFDHFIDRIIERDAAKLTRSRFTAKQRRKFATDLAWWLWQTSPRSTLTADQIPAGILERFATRGEDIDSVRRDLVAACFLDRARGGSLTFPHRSFQEFLVASNAVELLSAGRITVPEVDAVVNAEISDFMCNMTGVIDLARVVPVLDHYRGNMSERLARFWIADREKALWTAGQVDSHLTNPWYTQLSTLAAVRGVLPRTEFGKLTDKLLTSLTGGVEPQLALLRWRCLLQLGAALGEDRLVEKATEALLQVGTLRRSKGRSSAHLKFVPDTTVAGTLAKIHFGTRRRNVMDVRGTYAGLEQLLGSYCWLGRNSAYEAMPQGSVALRRAELIDAVRDYVSRASSRA